MKKIIVVCCLLVVLLIPLCLSGCGNKAAAYENPPEQVIADAINKLSEEVHDMNRTLQNIEKELRKK